GYVTFESEYALTDRLGLTVCTGITKSWVMVGVEKSTTPWTEHPNNQSKFTFWTDDVIKKMSMLRLDFIDIDDVEGVWNLNPWPDEIVDKNGRKDSFEIDIASHSIRSKVEDNTIYAYYYEIPD